MVVVTVDETLLPAGTVLVVTVLNGLVEKPRLLAPVKAQHNNWRGSQLLVVRRCSCAGCRR